MFSFKPVKITKIGSDPDRHDPNKIYKDIDRGIRMKNMQLILITGRGQAGKSVYGKFIAHKYDDKFIYFFQVPDILTHLSKINELRVNGFVPDFLKNKWTVYEEPNISGADKREWYSARNYILQSYTSSAPFLFNHLICTFPNLRGISETLFTNVTMWIKIIKFEKKTGLVRKAYVSKPNPFVDDPKSKYFWKRNYIIHTIEDLPEEQNSDYMLQKTSNFFDSALQEWLIKMNMSNKVKPNVKFDRNTGSQTIVYSKVRSTSERPIYQNERRD